MTKTVLLATVAALGMIGAASAADLSARMPVKAPPAPMVVPAFSWTGCYIGGFVGGAWSDDYSVYDRNGFAGVGSWGYSSDSSVIGGGTLGCNWQPVGSQFVLGLEGELGYISLEGSGADPLDPTIVAASKIGDWYGMITGRLGFAWDRALLYVKGGAAFLNVESSIYDSLTGFGMSTSDTVTTWTVGGGIEYALAPSWSIKAEYMYIGLNDTLATCGVYGGTAPAPGTYCWDHDNGGIHTAKVGLNYRFGGGAAPVMARY
ncbi:outer membrane beta-barrel protein [Rhodoplanes serenus]|uniref:Outer membrane beta-barrel protein n=1 Tax=Rhodoplanes serenus TaxID=200615 RepID=A0A9X4XPA6_9BRAD|nr:outer membrane protein [Rhodoplanes serenus]MTW17934.1 outer membrane beta-barrel protein [Rhodoplanes serenus]